MSYIFVCSHTVRNCHTCSFRLGYWTAYVCSRGCLFSGVWDFINISCRLGARLNTTVGGSLNTSFNLGSVCTTCQCFLTIFLNSDPKGEYFVTHNVELRLCVVVPDLGGISKPRPSCVYPFPSVPSLVKPLGQISGLCRIHLVRTTDASGSMELTDGQAFNQITGVVAITSE